MFVLYVHLYNLVARETSFLPFFYSEKMAGNEGSYFALMCMYLICSFTQIFFFDFLLYIIGPCFFVRPVALLPVD